MPDLGRKIGAVLFDLDGTLVHTRIDFARMKEEVLAEVRAAGLEPEPFRALDVLSIIRSAAAQLTDPEDFENRAEGALVRMELAACERAEEAAGARETLAWLAEGGVKVGIVTRNCRQAVQRALERVPLPHDVLLCRADTPRVKPDPIHLQLALKRLAVPESEAVMVGDHVMDILGGRAAGLATVGVLLPEHPPDYFHEAAPDRIVRKLPELRQWISLS